MLEIGSELSYGEGDGFYAMCVKSNIKKCSFHLVKLYIQINCKNFYV